MVIVGEGGERREEKPRRASRGQRRQVRMPLFKGSDSPGLDRLTRDEERKRDGANAEVLQAAGSGLTTLEAENERVLKRKAAEEPTEFLWPYLLGWQYLGAGRFEEALSVLKDAKTKRPGDLRGPYGVATVYNGAAAQACTELGPSAEGEVRLGMSMSQLHESALREFNEALQLAERGRDKQLIIETMAPIAAVLAARRATGGGSHA